MIRSRRVLGFAAVLVCVLAMGRPFREALAGPGKGAPEARKPEPRRFRRAPVVKPRRVGYEPPLVPTGAGGSEKAWGAVYPKIQERSGLGSLEFSLSQRGETQEMYDSSNGTRYRHAYAVRGPQGYKADSDLFPDHNVSSTPRIVNGPADGIPRCVFGETFGGFPEVWKMFAAILTDDPSQAASTLIQIPEPTYTHGIAGNVLGPVGFPRADSDESGMIHVTWARYDVYDPTPGNPNDPENNYTIYRVFYALVHPGDASNPSVIVPPSVVSSEIAFTSGSSKGIPSVYNFQAVTGSAGGDAHVLWNVIEYFGGSIYRHEVNYIRKSGGAWGSKELLFTETNSNRTVNYIDNHSLALKPDGTPAAIYNNNTANTLVYAERATGWAPEVVVNRPRPSDSSITIDSKGRALIPFSWIDSTFHYTLFRRDAPGQYSEKPDVSYYTAFLRLMPNDRACARSNYRLPFEDNLGTQDAYAMVGVGPGTQVNAANGNLHFRLPLLQTQGRGFPLVFDLQYNSLEVEGDLGLSQNWHHGHQVYLTEVAFDVLEFHRGDGAHEIFTSTSPYTQFFAQDKYGDFSKIEKGPIALGDAIFPWIMTDKFGMKYGFGTGNPSDASNHNKLCRIRDLNGNELNLSYGDNPATAGVAESNLLDITDSVGRQLHFTYTMLNQIDHVDFVIGGSTIRTWTFRYDATPASRLLRVEDSAYGPEGQHVWQFEYHTTNDFSTYSRKGLLSKVIPPKGTTYAWQYGYQADNRVVRATDPDGKKITVDYDDSDSAHWKAMVNDRNRNALAQNNPTTIEYDFQRSLATKITLPATTPSDGAVSIVRTFDQYRNELTFTDARGNTTTKTYAATAVPAYVKDNLASVQRPGNDASHVQAFTYTMDGLNRVATMTAERKAPTGGSGTVLTQMTYYPSTGNLQTRTFPDGAYESYTYNSFGQPLTFTDARGKVTTYGYGGAGDSYTGLMTSMTLPGSPPESYQYDERGNRTRYTTMAGGIYTSTYDLRDRLTASVEPTTVDATDPTTSTTYDLHDLVVTQTDALSQTTRFNYNILDRVTDQENALGDHVVRTFDPNGNVLTRTDLKGQVTTYTYDQKNRVVDELPPDVSPAPRPETLSEYDGNGNVVKVTRKGSPALGIPDQVTTMEYDGRNNLRFTRHPEVTDLDVPPVGTPTPTLALHVDETQYDESDLPIARIRTSNGTFETGSSTIYNFRGLPQETRQWRSAGGASFVAQTHAYDPAANLTATTDADGRGQTFTFDDRNRPLSTFDGRGFEVSRTEYHDAENYVVSLAQDPANPGTLIQSRKRVMNLRGQLYRSFDAQDQATTHHYDAAGNLKSTLDAVGNLVEQDYDALNRLIRTISHPTGGRSLITFYDLDANGNRLHVLDSNGHQWSTTFDALNRPVLEENPSLTLRTRGYDPFGNVLTEVDEGGHTVTAAYDNLNRRISEYHTGGISDDQSITYRYDGADRRTSETAELGVGSSVLHQYDALGRQVSEQTFFVTAGVVTPFRTVSYTYSDAGDRLTMASDDVNLGSWTYEHDSNHLLTSLGHSSGEVHAMTYDSGMRLLTHTMPNGCVETRTYDNKERLSRMTTKLGLMTVADLQYAFDASDNRTSIAYNHLGVTQDFEYDGMYRLTDERTTGGGLNLARCNHYDGAGNRTARFNNGNVTLSAYDIENRLVTETPAAWATLVTPSSVTVDSSEAGYTAAPLSDGNTDDATDPAHAWASENAPGAHTAVLLMGASDLLITQVKVFLPTSGGMVQRFKVQYWDGLGYQDLTDPNVTGATASSSLGWYTQTAHEVVFSCFVAQTTRIAFVQDSGGGNPTTPNQAFLNEFQAYKETPGETETLNYAPGGELLGDGGTIGRPWLHLYAYSYDWGHRLISRRRTMHAFGETEYAYDVLGRRMMRTQVWDTMRIQPVGEDGSLMPAIAFVTYYAYDGDDVIGDYDVGMNLMTRYTNGEGIDRKLTIHQNGTSYYYVPDALGSTHQLLSDAGTVVNQYLYTAWGEALLNSGPVVNRYQYAGRELDAESGLYCLRARTYDPQRGVFIQRDPAFSGTNWYGYAGGNPVNATDPLGLLTKESYRRLRYFKLNEDPEISNFAKQIISMHRFKEIAESGRPTAIKVNGKDVPMSPKAWQTRMEDYAAKLKKKTGFSVDFKKEDLGEYDFAVFAIANLRTKKLSVEVGLEQTEKGFATQAKLTLPEDPDCKSENGYTPSGEYLIDERRTHDKIGLDWHNLLPRKEDKSGYYGYETKNALGRCGMGLHPGDLSHGCITVTETKDLKQWSAVETVLQKGHYIYKNQKFTGFLWVEN